MADLKISQTTVLSWVTAIALTSIAFATIGATASDNKENLKMCTVDIKNNRERIHAQEISSKETEIRQQAILANQANMISKIDGLYYAEDVTKPKGK